MTVYTNASSERRIWPTLTNPATGRTVELAPGQQVELDVPVNDPYLQIVKVAVVPVLDPIQSSPAGEPNSEE